VNDAILGHHALVKSSLGKPSRFITNGQYVIETIMVRFSAKIPKFISGINVKNGKHLTNKSVHFIKLMKPEFKGILILFGKHCEHVH